MGVHTPFEIRKKRLAENRGWSEEVITAMESWQWPEKDKMAACAFVLDNTGPQSGLPAKVKKLLAALAERRKEQQAALAQKLTALWQ